MILILSLLTTAVYSQNMLTSSVVNDGTEFKLHVVDGLKLSDPMQYTDFMLRLNEIYKSDTLLSVNAIKKYGEKAELGAIELYTNRPIVLNGKLLITQSDKLDHLSLIESSNIKDINWLRRKAFFKKYGISSKDGGVEVTTF